MENPYSHILYPVFVHIFLKFMIVYISRVQVISVYRKARILFLCVIHNPLIKSHLLFVF